MRPMEFSNAPWGILVMHIEENSIGTMYIDLNLKIPVCSYFLCLHRLNFPRLP